MKEVKVRMLEPRLKTSAYECNRKLMEGSWSIPSSLNKRRFLGGDFIMQINKKDNVKHTTNKIEGMHNIGANGQLTHSQATSLSVS